MNRERKGNRLKNYDYSQPGYYFVTICVHPNLKGTNVFGTIKNRKMDLNQYGEIVSKQWVWIADRYEHIILDKWIIMPDHFHAIVKIVHTESDNNTVGTGCDTVGTGRDLSLHCNNPDQNKNKPSPRKYKPLDQIIGAFKTTSSKLIHLSGYNDYAWQRSYYDRIVRDAGALNQIRQYIINNPGNWSAQIQDLYRDRNHPN